MRLLMSWILYPLEAIFGLLLSVIIVVKNNDLLGGDPVAGGSGMKDVMGIVKTYEQEFKDALGKDKTKTKVEGE